MARRSTNLTGWTTRLMVLVSMMALLVAGTLATPTTTDAQGISFATGEAVVVDTDALNFRAAAGLDAAVLDILPYGTLGTILDGPIVADGYTWYQIDVAGVTGWVAGEFLAPAGDDGEGWPVGTVLEVADGPLNLRCCYGIGTDIIGVLAEGVRLEIIDGPVESAGYTWYAVYTETGSLGWVAGEFLGPVEDIEPGFALGDSVAVDTDALNFREWPGLDATILDVLPYGTLGTIIDGPISADGYTWYQIDVAGATGWVAGEFLREI